ncbi:MAG: hypothetical protein K6T54_02160 [Ignavibacterium sp.]|nr:hypothetical protein [Ignavibacterium sp.]
MTENLISLVILSDRVIFNDKKIKLFENFSVDDTKLLFGTLLFNLLENFSTTDPSYELSTYLDEDDKDYLSVEAEKFQFNTHKIYYYKNSPNASLLFDKIKNHKHTIILFADIMGVSNSSIKEILNLLNSDENIIVIGTSQESSLCFIGFNHQTENLQNAIQNSGRDYSKFLSLLKTEEHFIHTFNGFIRVNNISSFRELYSNLSQKKSIEYCSQVMHEKFTHLFVEYKDLLQ